MSASESAAEDDAAIVADGDSRNGPAGHASRNGSAGHAASRNVTAGHAASRDDAAGDATSRNDAAGPNASRHGATRHDATTDGHDDAYVSYYASFFNKHASRWTVPLLPTSLLRKCDRKGKRLKIRRGWRATKDLLKAGGCLYVVSRNRISVMSLVGWQVVEVQGSGVRAVSRDGERESDALHVSLL